jgi:hypothetical protein
VVRRAGLSQRTGRRRKIARFLLGVQRRFPPAAPEVRFISFNGRQGVVVLSEAAPRSAFTFEWSGDRVWAIYAMRNPEKLRRLAGPA